MSGIQFVPDTEYTRYELQKLTRERFIEYMLAEILFDLNVCALEGWDQMEFIDRIKHELETLGGNSDELQEGNS